MGLLPGHRCHQNHSYVSAKIGNQKIQINIIFIRCGDSGELKFTTAGHLICKCCSTNKSITRKLEMAAERELLQGSLVSAKLSVRVAAGLFHYTKSWIRWNHDLIEASHQHLLYDHHWCPREDFIKTKTAGASMLTTLFWVLMWVNLGAGISKNRQNHKHTQLAYIPTMKQLIATVNNMNSCWVSL